MWGGCAGRSICNFGSCALLVETCRPHAIARGPCDPALALPNAREATMMSLPRPQRLLSRHDGADHARMRAKSTEPRRRKGGEKMASALQLPREELLRAYRQMRTIREFEDTVHDEFSAGSIPGFVHLYAGEEASGVGVCLHLDDRDAIASTPRGHGHCIPTGADLVG